MKNNLRRDLFQILAIAAISITMLFFEARSVSHAQTTCATVVSYSVERDKADPLEVFYGELKAQGLEEAAIKYRLESDVLRAKNKALEHCRSKFENTAGCLQGKMGSSASALQSASFSARKALEDALLADCKKQQGLCKEAKSTEIQCVTAEPVATADPKAAGAKGAEVKKEEKKK